MGGSTFKRKIPVGVLEREQVQNTRLLSLLFFFLTKIKMVLFVIGLGLSDESDITLKGLEAVKSSEKVYLEAYTSILMVKDYQKRLVSFNLICLAFSLSSSFPSFSSLGITLREINNFSSSRSSRTPIV